jgi:hypothetical protein
MNHLKFAALLCTSVIIFPAKAQEAVNTPVESTTSGVEAQAMPAESTQDTAEAVIGKEIEAKAETVGAAATASASTDPALMAIGTPEKGKALVVFFRPGKFIGSAIGFKVREGETELGKLRNAKYFTIQVEPGKHVYAVHSEAEDLTTMEAEADETYFFSGELNMGVVAGRPNLSPSSFEAFKAAFPKLKKAKPLDD